MRIHVTGAESFIGKALIKRCREVGIVVTGSDLTISQSPEIVIGDIRSPNFASVLEKDTDTLVHLAALSRESDCHNNMDAWMRTNVLASENVMRCAARAGIRRIVFASSEWVYDYFGDDERSESESIDPIAVSSEYGLSKLLAESVLRQIADEVSIELVILRFGIVYGPRANNWSAVEALLNDVCTKDQVRVGSLRTSRRFIHVRDIADAICANLSSGDIGVFNVQGPRLVALGEVVEIAKKLSGNEPKILEINPQEVSVRRVCSQAIEKATGWQPRIEIDEGMKDVFRFMTEETNV